MRKKITKYGPGVLLGFTFLMLVFLNIFYQDHWLDSDMAAEMMFSKILADTGHVFATPQWYYSTEFRFLYTQLVMAPLFRVLSDWHVIRTITNLVFYGLMTASCFYFMKPLKVSKGLMTLTSCVLLLPFSETMMTHMQMGNTYLSHVIIIYLCFGMFLRLAAKNENESDAKKHRLIYRALLLVCYLALSVICGVSGVRYLLALQCPMVIAAFLYLLKSEQFQCFRREMTKEHLIELLRSPSASYFGYSLLGAVASVAGYAVNVLWVSRRYVFQTYDATNFIPIYQGELFERLQNAIGCLLMLFGYIPEKGFLSLRGFISMIAFVLLAVLVYCAVKQLKRSSGVHFFLTVFLIVAFFLNLFVFTFTTSTMVPRYYLTILMFALPVTALFLEQESLPFDRLAVVVILAGCLMVSTAKTVFSFISVDKNADKREVAAFLQEKDYDFGFATYTNGNIITELTNGEVEIANIGDPQYLEYFKWSSPMKYYEEDYHDGEVFLLLTAEETMQFADTQAVQQGRKVYEDGKYVVLLYDSRVKLMSCADSR